MSAPPRSPFLDLQSFLSHLDAAGRLNKVQPEVDKDWEIACVARLALESMREPDSPAILFENVKGHDIPVVVNLFHPRAAYAAALGVDPDDTLEHWAAALQRPQPTVPIKSGPVQEVVKTDDAADLLSLPVPVWTPGRDAGPYLSAASVITRDPETGIQNLASYRVQVHEARRAGLFFGSRMQHGAIHLTKHHERGEPMPVALVVGAPPAVNFAAAAKTEYGVDELTIAGGLADQGLEVVPGVTVDLMVPAHAECVIEGMVSGDAREIEGPFGEALGYMEDAGPAPVIEVTAICHRNSPVHHGYVQQLPPSDGHLVMELGLLGPLWYYVTRKLGLQGVRDLAIARGSAGLAMLLVQVERSHTHKAAEIGRVLAKINFGQKFIYLVDEDIDIRDPETANWVLSSRVDPQRDIAIVEDSKTFQLDPSILARAEATGQEITEPPYPSSLAIINATLKTAAPEIALPTSAFMQQALARWEELGLQPIRSRERLNRLLEAHSEDN